MSKDVQPDRVLGKSVNIACDLDALRYRLHASAELVRTCYVALTQGENVPCEGDYDALYAAYGALSNLVDKELSDTIGRLFASLYSERAELEFAPS